MSKYYPEGWLPAEELGEWSPDRILMSQTNSMHGDWYEEQHNIRDWVRESQKHQAFATTIMTDALRRRSDKVVSTAVHLLIDAWPSGWMKTLVGVDRIPKPAYFTFKKSLKPVRVNLRCDRWKAYEDDEIEIEAWLLNDTHCAITGSRIAAVLRDDEREYGSYEISCGARPVSPEYAGTIRVRLPEADGRRYLYIDAALQDENGTELDSERFRLEVFQRHDALRVRTAAYIGEKAYGIAYGLGMKTFAYSGEPRKFDILVISDTKEYEKVRDTVENTVREGACVLFTTPESGLMEWKFNEKSYIYKSILGGSDVEGIGNKDGNGVFFIARDAENKRTCRFRPDDFSYWYNADRDMLDFTAANYIDAGEGTPLLFSYGKPSFFERLKGKKKRLPVASEITYGEGRAIFVSLCLEGRIGYNPVLSSFIEALII